MDEESRRKELDSKLRRSGLILNDPNVVDAMEHIPLGSEARFLPVRVSKRSGAISGDALASAVQLGKLRKHPSHPAPNRTGRSAPAIFRPTRGTGMSAAPPAPGATTLLPVILKTDAAASAAATSTRSREPSSGSSWRRKSAVTRRRVTDLWA